MCHTISCADRTNSLISDAASLNTEKPNRLRGVLWITAAAAAVVAGCIFSGLGSALLVGASNGIAFKGIELSAFFVGAGLAMLFAGVPAGLKAAFNFVGKGWTDLTHRKVVNLA